MPHLDADFVLPAQAAAAAATTSTKDVQALRAQLRSERANSARECRAACRTACQAACQAATRAEVDARKMRAKAAAREALLTAANSQLEAVRQVSAALPACAHAAPACRPTSSSSVHQRGASCCRKPWIA